MCKHWSTTAKPFGVVVIAALPAAGFEGTRFEMNCCEACLLAIAHVVKEREKS
jgi:hypothetical protein